MPIGTKQLPSPSHPASLSQLESRCKRHTYQACFLHSHAPAGLWCSSHRCTLPHLPAGTLSGFLRMPPPWHFCREWIHTPVVREWWPGGCYLSQVVQKMSNPSIAFSLFFSKSCIPPGKRNRGRSTDEANTQQVILYRWAALSRRGK